MGGSIEDATGDAADQIYDFELAVERVAAAAEAARICEFILTARAKKYLHGRPDLEDTVKRLQAFERAGADVLYAPGLPSLDAIREVCRSVAKPVNVVMGLKGMAYTVDQLADAGVKRISVGGSFARAALGAFLRAAREVKEKEPSPTQLRRCRTPKRNASWWRRSDSEPGQLPERRVPRRKPGAGRSPITSRRKRNNSAGLPRAMGAYFPVRSTRP